MVSSSLPYLFLSFGFLQVVLHGINGLLETLPFINLDHLLFVGVVGLQLFHFDPGAGQRDKSYCSTSDRECKACGNQSRSSYLLVFSSKEFHKVAFLAPGLFQVLGGTYYLKHTGIRLGK